jgi:two-component system, NtrC family, sensor kinase
MEITGHGETRLEDFHELSLRLIRYAEKGRIISDYFRNVSLAILDFSGGEILNIVTGDINSLYRYSYSLDSGWSLHPLKSYAQTKYNSFKGPENGEPFPCGLKIESLEAAVLNAAAENSAQATAGGGLMISDTSAAGVLTDYTSFLILPLKKQNKIVGVMSLGWKKPVKLEEDLIAHYQFIFNLIGFSKSYRRTKFLLGERIKELRTIYQISRLGSEIGLTLDDILAKAADIIPRGFLHPESACCRIIYSNQTFHSKNYKPPIHMLKENIAVGSEVQGFVEVGYTRELEGTEKEPFLKEEQPMLRAIAGELGHVAERKHFEDERERLQQQLLHADRLVTVGQLTAGVAHELNEPLGGILGFAQLIKKYGDINEGVEKDIDKIIKASLHGREIIRKLMLFSRQTPPEKMAVDINERIEDGLSLLESRFKKSSITLIKDLAEDLPPVDIDPSQLSQVLVNLVVNAIQAMPDGGTLTIKTVSSINAILLIIKDTGVGMTGEQIDKIFIPFYTTKGINEGVGLGLPVALGIVQSHRGTIIVESEPGKGTVFTVKFPTGGEDNNG